MNKKRLSQGLLNALFVALVAVNLFPILWMLSSSLKSPNELFASTAYLIPKHFSLENYHTVLRDYAFGTWLRNSVVSTLGIFALQIAVSLMAAFAVSFFKTRLTKFGFYFLLITMVIPFQVTMIPNYIVISRIQLLNTMAGVVLPYAANAATFFYLYQNVRGIPQSYYEVAKLEGARPLWIFWHVVIGLSVGALSAISILTVIESWNLYFWPMLVLTKAETRTLTVAFKQFLDFEMGNRWGPFMATATLASLPTIICFLFFQRGIINAFVSAGIKG